MSSSDAVIVCAQCGHHESQHLKAPLMCATCARENRDGAFHVFQPTSVTADDPRHPEYSEWVHTTSVGGNQPYNAKQFRVGDLFGWRDKRSETGWLSGYIREIDHTHLRVRVGSLAAGKL